MDQLKREEGGTELRISVEQLEEMVQQAAHLTPEEACGLLGGSNAEVLKVYPVPNILHNPVRYQMDAEEQLKVFLEIENNGWDLVGIYHSHPNGPDQPSATDLQEAYYPDAVYLILSPDGDTWRCRGYCIREGQCQEVAVRVRIPGKD